MQNEIIGNSPESRKGPRRSTMTIINFKKSVNKPSIITADQFDLDFIKNNLAIYAIDAHDNVYILQEKHGLVWLVCLTNMELRIGNSQHTTIFELKRTIEYNNIKVYAFNKNGENEAREWLKGVL